MSVKYFFLIIASFFMVSPPATAQESDPHHPFLSDRFQLGFGVFSRNQGFKIGANGLVPEEEIDFDEAIGVDEDDASGAFTFRWNFGEKWSLWSQGWRVNSTGGQVVTEDIDWENVTFGEGTFVRGGVENTVVRVFFGREFSIGPRHEFGLGLGFHWLEIKAFLEGEAQINEQPIGFHQGDVSVGAPMPNIGGWYYFSPSKRWLIEARLDWLDASVGDYSGGIWNSSIGVNFQMFEHLGVGLAYQYFSLDAAVDSDDWNGAVELKYRGPFLSLTTNW
jgi:hypothetical protein